MTAPVSTSPALHIRALTRLYGERAAVSDLDLDLPTGQTLAVLGPNGSGKTTLLRVIAALLRPHRGTVEVLGHPLPQQAHATRGRVGLLAHDPLLYRELTPRENLALHAALHDVPTARIDELLDAVELPAARSSEPVRTLSRGNVQRVAACRAVLHDPELLLLDEPRANLDPHAVELLEPLIGPAPGRTRVITSHDPTGARTEADRILGLRAGRAALDVPATDADPDALSALYA